MMHAQIGRTVHASVHAHAGQSCLHAMHVLERLAVSTLITVNLCAVQESSKD